METVTQRHPGPPRPRLSVNPRWVTVVLVACVLVYNAWRFYQVVTTEFAPKHSRCGPGSADSRIVVPITNSTSLSDGSLETDYGRFLPGEYWTEDGVTWGCLCLHFRSELSCGFKCCPFGELFVSPNNLTCELDKLHTFRDMFVHYAMATLSLDDHVFDLFLNDNFNCDQNAGLFGSQIKPFALVRNGVFIGSDIGLTDLDKYCADYAGGHYDQFYCVQNTYLDNWSNTPNKVYAIVNLFGVFMSTVCLVVTIAVYSLNPDHRNLHGMLLLSYFISLTSYYVWFFTRFIWNQYFYEERSVFASTLIYFEDLISLAFVCWLTVICFNMWRVLGENLKPLPASHLESKHLKYLVYSCFGWGIPILTGTLRHLGIGRYILSWEYHKLWYLQKTNKLLFHIPGTAMLEVNCVFFLSMLWTLRSHFRKTRALSVAESQTHGQVSKGGIMLYSKLALTTGLDWALMRVCLSGQATSVPVVGYTAVTLFHYQGVVLFILLTADKTGVCGILLRPFSREQKHSK